MKKIALVIITCVGLSAQAQTKPVQDRFEEHKQKMWKAVDSNGDNKISRQEALAKANELFSKQDLNKDGVLTPNEVQYVPAAEVKKPPPPK